MDDIGDGFAVVPVRTPTLPPATHTNTWVVGRGRLSVFDPASPYDDEQQRLFDLLQERMAAGERVERLVLTHHHHDHVMGVENLRARLREVGVDAPVVAHPVTAGLVAGRITVDEPWTHHQVVSCGGVQLRGVFTPGHAPGHLAFVDPASGTCIAGDMVAGVGTIAIDPSEGDLGDYLASLQRLLDEGATRLLPAHGPVLEHAETVVSFYIAHRHQRTEQIGDALRAAGEQTPRQLADIVYAELDPQWRGMAARQILTHLRWMQQHGLAHPGDAPDAWVAT